MIITALQRAVVCLLVATCAFAQGNVVAITDRPEPESVEILFFRDGSGNYDYECKALARNKVSVFSRSASTSIQPETTISVATLTSIAVSTNVATATTSGAHGLGVGHRIRVSGATVDTDLGSSSSPKEYTIATVPSGTTFTFATASVADATYNESTLRFDTSAPRTNSRVWNVIRRFYTSTAVDRIISAYGSGAMDKACDSKATYFE